MSDKNTLFYRKNTAISIDFSAEQISSDGSLILLEKLEREHNPEYSSHICKIFFDNL